jgi:glycine dehydrogenase
MLKVLSPPAESMEQFVKQVIPENILSNRPLLWKTWGQKSAAEGLPEHEVLTKAKMLAGDNRPDFKSLIGAGYYGTRVPEVIKRNILESPAWYTSYTPYQPEISQGRLESLLNFQTLVSDLTGLPISNASLLDEGTAAAEAMTVSFNALTSSRARRPGKTYVVSDRVHPQTIAVMRGRAEGFGIAIKVMNVSGNDLSDIEALGEDLVGVMVQYPDTCGQVYDYKTLADQVHKQGAVLASATDLLALTLLTPPGEWGADIAFGSAQRLGVPMGFGGPHAAFFAVTEQYKRKIPGRLVGVSKDRRGGHALRLALQTREQHIRREKATSNVCTAQALLANMSAMYAIYHGPEGLKAIAERCRQGARVVQNLAEHYGWEVLGGASQPVPFDTVVIVCPPERVEKFYRRAQGFKLNLRMFPDGTRIGISIDEETTYDHLASLAKILSWEETGTEHSVLNHSLKLAAKADTAGGSPGSFDRQSAYLTHPVFNSHHSETELLRYIHHLQSKDLSLVHSMIPLGSCTMKLNASTQMAIISEPGFANLHPHVPFSQRQGYSKLISSLETQLASITGMNHTSLQPNSGAQGEFAGLRTIRKYHEANGEHARDICLIPKSAHGTNPASAAMAGMRVVPINCDTKTGNLDIADLVAKCKQHSSELGAIMITYPSTYGVFEPEIKMACDIVHTHGGQVYMDGANMNAQIGLCSPGEIGADVCHLNLHKTFCIPHGGGGPGVGPICVKSHLVKFVPEVVERDSRADPTTDLASDSTTGNFPISSAPYGSASILPISWAYNTLMGGEGLKRATEITLLNANYLLCRLQEHYPILYTNQHGRCAHEFILDARPFAASAGVEAIDIAKRLQDYGFHAPTMSWPVAGTLMIEPTESESKEELDRFVDALVSIREEIREIEDGRMPRKGNVLKMAPHPIQDIVGVDAEDAANWDRPYSREKAAYPLPWLRETKFWPSVARVDDCKSFFSFFFFLSFLRPAPYSLKRNVSGR